MIYIQQPLFDYYILVLQHIRCYFLYIFSQIIIYPPIQTVIHLVVCNLLCFLCSLYDLFACIEDYFMLFFVRSDEWEFCCCWYFLRRNSICIYFYFLNKIFCFYCFFFILNVIWYIFFSLSSLMFFLAYSVHLIEFMWVSLSMV